MLKGHSGRMQKIKIAFQKLDTVATRARSTAWFDDAPVEADGDWVEAIGLRVERVSFLLHRATQVEA